MPSHSVKQAKVMSAIAHGWHPTGKAAGIPVSVAKEFHAADAGHKYGKGMARGGPTYLGHGFQRMDGGGFVNSAVPGRTDKHNRIVESGSYVLPADHVSALGENNSLAGADVVKKMFAPGTQFGARLAVPKFANGGGVNNQDVPVIVAGGEFILPPSIVRRIGNGDLEKGHAILDRWVLETRKKHIKKLKSLKPPKGADE